MSNDIAKILASRKLSNILTAQRKIESEGGCGVIGVASDIKISGKHLLQPLIQMKNRGNGKGGGIAAAGLSPNFFGISQDNLDHNYLIAIAYLDFSVEQDVIKDFLHPLFTIEKRVALESEREVPQSVLYFVNVKKETVDLYRERNQLELVPENAIEDELVYQNSYRLNRKFYASEGEKKAFVLSHGKNLLVLKCVGFGDDAIRGYHIEDLEAHVWVGHHRYPTKGRVWHPGGAHPFVGLHEALVHNGDFANYSSLCEYLAQRNIYPLFLTDTEVSALLFDLLSRTYAYPLEYVLEALAPTTERDFFSLPSEKKEIYRLILKTHLHASPDGPWFFIIAQSHFRTYRLIGITDTSMLRPQVFALQIGKASLGMIASEKQAVDAFLQSLSATDSRFWQRADYYWSCRGGSYTDGGSFVFTIKQDEKGDATFDCVDKFGKPFARPTTTFPSRWQVPFVSQTPTHFPDRSGPELYTWTKQHIINWSYDETNSFLNSLQKSAFSHQGGERALFVLTKLIDHHYPMHRMRRSFVLAQVDLVISNLISILAQNEDNEPLVIDGRDLKQQGPHSLANQIIKKYQEGHKKFIVGNCLGHRFIGNGLGPASHGVEIDVYGSAGDYLASGIDGAHIRLHNNGQDQLGQIMKDGKLIVFGDVGQTLLYGAKGGTVFIRGNTAGRTLINAVGNIKLIINGTSLDYFAESFMAGDPLRGGGCAIINRIGFNEHAEIVDLYPPYPGGNLFSLASGGAIYIRDPDRQLGMDQLNGGQFAEFTILDQNLIAPYLEENARLFDIPLSRLLERNGRRLTFQEVYRKIVPAPTHFIDPERAWVNHGKFVNKPPKV